ncbi:MAG: hypothetical protein QOG87_1513 [Actinomycetota bacterium]|jgi:hypothetical protein
MVGKSVRHQAQVAWLLEGLGSVVVFVMSLTLNPGRQR